MNVMGGTEMIKCPICGKAMRIDFGLDDDMRDLGYFCGTYADEQVVIREYEKLVSSHKGASTPMRLA